MLLITPQQRRELSAQAHSISPIVMIGKLGLSPSVIGEIDKALLSHELIKVKVAVNDKKIRETLLEEICLQLHAAPVNHIGRVLVLYRPKPIETEKTPATSLFKKKREPRRSKRSYQL